jgi:hypothetical protein
MKKLLENIYSKFRANVRKKLVRYNRRLGLCGHKNKNIGKGIGKKEIYGSNRIDEIVKMIVLIIVHIFSPVPCSQTPSICCHLRTKAA